VAAAGYLALTRDEFVSKISDFYMYKTGIGTNLMLMTLISFVVGLSISGQTFYTFILENLDKFGALKAIGAKGHELVSMILFRRHSSHLRLRVWCRLCASLIWLARARLPDYAAMITYWNLAMAFVMVVIIAAISSYIGVRKVLKIEPSISSEGDHGSHRNTGTRKSTNVRGRLRQNSRGAGCDLRAKFGEMLYVVGPSGSGKTTMLSIISEYFDPSPAR